MKVSVSRTDDLQTCQRLRRKVFIKEPGMRIARLGAQTQALGFYERLGFAVAGPEYQDAGIPHYDMERAV